MAVTALGKFLRKLRIDREERLYDMAKKVGVSSAFLSGVENGHKKVPASLVNDIASIYNLDAIQIQELNDAVELSKGSLDLTGFSPEKQETMLKLARKFDDLTDKDKSIITTILMKGDDKNS
ncbi:transcriptional regulator with XRE-family HTH domain [Lactobacillus colini]|uniref:Transcriptional regulator with XRE-family HTH domain n=1 Tax=Lactobacillus colini TaxID=1819254 RepID=A0ABS4ME17_9LACO|nr:helix-turn-helix transcriptional regulator [Lactobacillus colini]MBP2057930.1 transcriptional regulator with XRE-family HTH domain [Lactobacillus colini]